MYPNRDRDCQSGTAEPLSANAMVGVSTEISVRKTSAAIADLGLIGMYFVTPAAVMLGSLLR
jgi:hypothetical protein